MGKRRKVDPAKLAAFRNSRSFDQTELATRLRKRGHGATQATVSRWENGQEPRAYVLPDLAAELGVSIEDLYEDNDDEEAASMPTHHDLGAALNDMIARAVEAQLRQRVNA